MGLFDLVSTSIIVKLSFLFREESLNDLCSGFLCPSLSKDPLKNPFVGYTNTLWPKIELNPNEKINMVCFQNEAVFVNNKKKTVGQSVDD